MIDEIRTRWKLEEPTKDTEALESWEENQEALTYEEMETWWKILYKDWKRRREKAEEEEIQNCIEERYGMIVSDQRRMINSLLEKPHRNIKIDRILKEENGKVELLTEKEEILEEVKSHFEKQFRERKVDLKRMSERWKRIYRPAEEINTEDYKDLEQEVTLEEWEEALRNTKNKSAPGPTGITYPLLKEAGKEAKELFRTLANKCIILGIMPKKWKLGMLYPIPKREDWCYNLNNVRPILLLETFRKTVVRILNTRLSRVLKDKGILKGRNFAGLPGEGTAAPIHLINCLLEDAREQKKEIWLLFQDMKKAFDSVSIKMLELALERIKLPQATKNFILQLYYKREMEVITSVGNTEPFVAKDGIDQGEVISPLVWRIFYDPLLVAIQEQRKAGHRMVVEWPKDIRSNMIQQESLKIEVIAYADDTTYIASTKEDLEKTIEIAEEFYKINDIEINPKKSELLVVKPRKEYKKSIEKINFGPNKEVVIEKKEKDLTRFLGIWLAAKNGYKQIENIIKNEVYTVTKQLRRKKASLAHMVYINNMVLLPRIEFRAQLKILSKQCCDQLQSPILKLIKNKARMPSTTPNALVMHKKIVGLQSIWQRQVAHHFTELLVRLNNEQEIGIATWLRLKKAQIDLRSYKCVLEIEENTLNNLKFQNNLNIQVLKEAKKLDISFRSEEIEKNLKLANKGTEIVNILTEEDKQKFLQHKNYNIFMLEQLLDNSGTKMITWKQMKMCRGTKTKGKKAKWFQKLEEEVIEYKRTRQIKRKYQREGRNNMSLRATLTEIKSDQRFKEWILLEEGKGALEFGKIRRKYGKERRTLVIEHWTRISEEEENKIRIQPCKGCYRNEGERELTQCLFTRKFQK